MSRNLGHRFCLAVILAWIGIGCQATLGQEVLPGQLEIADPNIMQGLGKFEIRAFGFNDERKQQSSHVKKTESDADGKFEIQVTEFGTMVAALSKDRRIAGWVWVEPGDEKITVPLGFAASIKGKLVWAETEEPLADHLMMAMTPMAPDGSNSRSSFGNMKFTDEDGEFELKGLLPGVPYRISIGVTPSKDDPVGVSYRLLLDFVSETTEDWDCGTIKVTGNGVGRIYDRVPKVSIKGYRAKIDESKDAFETLQQRLEASPSDDKRVLLFYRGERTSEAETQMDRVLDLAKQVLGERLQLMRCSERQVGAQTLAENLQATEWGDSWLAVVESDSSVVANYKTSHEGRLPLFYWDPRLKLKLSPPVAQSVMELVHLAAPEATPEELADIATRLGYPKLPIMEDLEKKSD